MMNMVMVVVVECCDVVAGTDESGGAGVAGS